MKSAKLEWQLGCQQKALELLAVGVKEYGDFPKVRGILYLKIFLRYVHVFYCGKKLPSSNYEWLIRIKI